MKRVLCILVTVTCLLVAPVVAQEKYITLYSQPIPESDLITIQDDSTGNFLLISLSSGEYKFYRCRDGLTFAGIGTVKLNGCAVTFESIDKLHRVLASVDECDQQAKAAIEIFTRWGNKFDIEPIKEYLSDSNMRDSTTECTTKAQSTKP
ncbi:MAG: hypothetical protein AB1757_26275 [Acidobacteriota bacterium]